MQADNAQHKQKYKFATHQLRSDFAFVLPGVTMDVESNMPIADTDIEWLACEWIEQVPGKVSGRPITRGTRILPDAIVNSYDAGESLEEIQEDYPGLSIPQIQRLIEFARVPQMQASAARS